MNDYLERLEKLLVSQDQDKLKVLGIEVKASIAAYADLVDSLKKQHYGFTRKLDELCLIRAMIEKQMKEKPHDH